MPNRLLGFALCVLLFAPTAHAEDGERTVTASGLAVTVLEPGAGAVPEAGDRVTIHYDAHLADGTPIGSTRDRDRPFETKMEKGLLLEGVYEGLGTLREGARARFEIPAALAYGEAGKPSRTAGEPPIVPPDTDVVYEVELLEVVRAPRVHEPAAADWIEVAPGLRYAVLEAGTGEPPKPSQRVQLRFALWNHRGALVQSTFEERKQLDGQLARLRLAEKGAGEPFLPRVVGRMRPGSRVWVEAEAPHTWGAQPAHEEIPPNTKTWWELELLEVSEIPSFDDLDRSLPETTTPSGLQYRVLRRGGGRRARVGRSNEVHYVGWLPDGTLFETSFKTGRPYRTELQNVIEGWIEGIALMREGDVFLFNVPGKLGYGERGSPPKIGPNQTLLFWVELKQVW